MKPKQQKKELRKSIADWQKAYRLIKHARNFYTQEDLEQELQNKLNEDSIKKLGKRIWTHSDATEILSQLLESGKIKKGGILWKNRLTVTPQKQNPHHLLPLLQV